MNDGARSSRIIAGVDRRRLASDWRTRADRLDAYARGLRSERLLKEAEDAEQAATEYRIAADELDLENPAAPIYDQVAPGVWALRP